MPSTQHLLICNACGIPENYPHSPTVSLRNSKGGGGGGGGFKDKTTCIKGKYEAKLEFQRGGGGGRFRTKTFGRGEWIFSGRIKYSE